MYKCKQCSYITIYKCNFTRHNSIHKDKNDKTDKNEASQNTPEFSENTPEFSENTPEFSENYIECDRNSDTGMVCEFCETFIKNKKNFNRHLQTCRGVPILACTVCKGIFSSVNSRWKHEKQCRAKKELEMESERGLNQTHISQSKPHTIQNTTNTTHNNITNTHNGDQNIQINLNIVNFPEKVTTDEPTFLITDTQKRKLLELVSRKDIEKPNDLVNAIMVMFEDHTKIPFRKKNLNSGYTHICKGNTWEPAPDNEVYPNVLIQASHEIVNALDDADVGDRNGRNYLGRNIVSIGKYFDTFKEIKEDGLDYGRLEVEKKRHKAAFKTGNQRLKLKAAKAYQACGLPD